jgi:hypothetical protein
VGGLNYAQFDNRVVVDEGTKVVKRKQALASDSMVETSRSGNQLTEDQI